MKQITVLDRDTMRIEPIRPNIEHQWQSYDYSPPEAVAARLAKTHVAITNKVPITAETIARCDHLELICLFATGYDIIDIDACREKKIAVCNLRAYANRGIAEHVMGLILALSRHLVDYHTKVLAGEWSDSPSFSLDGGAIDEVIGKRLGIVGAGNLGRATGALAAQLGMEVCYLASHDKETPADPDIPRLDFDTLLSNSDIISVHCPLTKHNQHLFDAAAFAKMKRGAIFINTARGGLVDNDALVGALKSGHLAGAGIDVLDTEPPPKDHPLLMFRHPALIITPHVAWAGRSCLQLAAEQLCENIEQFYDGTPQRLLTPLS